MSTPPRGLKPSKSVETMFSLLIIWIGEVKHSDYVHEPISVLLIQVDRQEIINQKNYVCSFYYKARQYKKVYFCIGEKRLIQQLIIKHL